jgi:hypothetical protein
LLKFSIQSHGVGDVVDVVVVDVVDDDFLLNFAVVETPETVPFT